MSVFKYFEDFLSIPRKSGNEKEISDYLVKFAINNGLEYYQDSYSNVIIKRNSNNNSKNTIILQGHIDMVCVSDVDYDFDNNGIKWYIEDCMYKAYNTSLGADNGIGCSIILEVLSNKDIKVPNIEAIFTTNEETNMLGAKRLDYSKITGKDLISIDGTDEGVIEVSSAGMVSILFDKKINYELKKGLLYHIKITGLLGGHSGKDIDKGRINSIKLMFDILNNIFNYSIAYLDGGVGYNVIPNTCECIISTPYEIDVHNFDKKFNKYVRINKIDEEKCVKVIKKEDFSKIIDFMHTLPVGVISTIDSYPQTSCNLACINTSNEHLTIKISIRSSNSDEESKVMNTIKNNLNGMNMYIVDKLPYFNNTNDSYIRELLKIEYKKLTNKECIEKHVHAGLEGGIFKDNINNLSISVISPNIYDIHSINERVDINSTIRVYNWLVNVLNKL